MEGAKEQRSDIKTLLDKHEEDIQKVKEDLQKFYDKKNQMREDYFQLKMEFELERDEVYHAEWVAREKQKLIDNQKFRQEKIEARK